MIYCYDEKWLRNREPTIFYTVLDQIKGRYAISNGTVKRVSIRRKQNIPLAINGSQKIRKGVI